MPKLPYHAKEKEQKNRGRLGDDDARVLIERTRRKKAVVVVMKKSE
jgi:hypothetical protein